MRRTLAFVLLAIFLAGPIVAQAQNHAIESDASGDFLFVLSAESGVFDGTTLSLVDFAPAMTYFANRPGRIAGQAPVESLLRAWSEGEDSFKADPPNGVVSIFAKNGATNVTVELMNPRIEGSALKFDIKLLNGTLPETFNEASLFIDNAWGCSPIGVC